MIGYMKFNFKNFGNIDDGLVDVGDLTIICGPNNSGKTYVSYAIYGFYKFFSQLLVPSIEDSLIEDSKIKALLKQGSTQIDLSPFLNKIETHFESASLKFSSTLHEYFNTHEDFFSEAKVSVLPNNVNFNLEKELKAEIHLGNEKNANILLLLKEYNSGELNIVFQTSKQNKIPAEIIKHLISRAISSYFSDNLLNDPFIVSSERTGVSLFHRSLSKNKSAAFDYISKNDTIDPFELINKMRSDYAQPINNNIEVVSKSEEGIKTKSYFLKNKTKYQYIFSVLQELIGGKYVIVNKQINFQPKKEKNRPSTLIPIYLASSSVKSLYLLDLFINTISNENSFLLIDEPELNLHPDNQRKIADLIIKLVNSGVKVLITTHSDYIIREFNNRIMLGHSSNKKKLMKEFGLNDSDILTADQVRAYTFCNHGINCVDIDTFGMNMKMFDDVINNSNKIFEKIYYSID